MFKKLFTFFVAATLSLSMASSAFAIFQDFHLIRVVYERGTGTTETLTDLGEVKAVIASGGTFAGSLPSVTDPANLFVAYFALDGYINAQLWATSKTGITMGDLTTMTSGSVNVYNYYNGPLVTTGVTATGQNFGIGVQSYNNSYRTKLSAAAGTLSNTFIPTAGVETSLASMVGATSGSVNQTLYFWADGYGSLQATPALQAAANTGVAVATITTNFDGSTIISPPPPSFAVNFISAGNGTLTGTTSQTVNSGASATAVSAVPSTGYHFVNWTGSGGFVTTITNPLTVTNVTADQTITANFAVDAVTSYTVDFISGGNGTISGTPSQTVNSGAAATAVTAVPAIGYHFVNWTGSGGFVTSATNPLTVTNVTADQTITANFAIDTFTVTPSIGIGAANGSITPTAAQTVAYNGSASFTVTPTGSYIASVSGSCGGTLTGTTYTTNPATADCTVIANFSQIILTVTASAAANGTVSPASQQVADSAIATITVTPANGYDIATVTGCSGSLSGTSYSTAPVTADCSVTATFNITTFALNFTSGAHGSLSGSSSQSVGYGSSAAAVTAIPDAGYHFVNWTGTGGFLTSNSNPLTVANVTAAQNITATFAIDTYTLSFASGGNGTLSGATSQTVNYGAAATAVTAAPASGYYFVNWGDGVSVISSSNPLTLSNVTAAQTITANFALIPPIQFTVAPVSGPHGSVSPAVNQSVTASATTSFVITPDSGYQISTVSGCNGTLNRSNSTYTTAGILGNCTVEATFIAIPSGYLQDALKALRFAIGLEMPTAADIASADVAPLTGCVANSAGLLTCSKSPDGTIDIADVVAIMQKTVGILSW